MSENKQLFCKAEAYIDANLERTVTAEELAQHLHISKSTLFRSFRTCTGMSVHRYIMKVKIEKATQLLCAGRSVAQTAEQLGFGTPGYFSARYKKETGRNPSEVIRK